MCKWVSVWALRVFHQLLPYVSVKGCTRTVGLDVIMPFFFCQSLACASSLLLWSWAHVVCSQGRIDPDSEWSKKKRQSLSVTEDNSQERMVVRREGKDGLTALVKASLREDKARKRRMRTDVGMSIETMHLRKQIKTQEGVVPVWMCPWHSAGGRPYKQAHRWMRTPQCSIPGQWSTGGTGSETTWRPEGRSGSWWWCTGCGKKNQRYYRLQPDKKHIMRDAFCSIFTFAC